MNNRFRLTFVVLNLSVLILFALCLLLGSVRVPLDAAVRILVGGGGDSSLWNAIILSSRLPQAITAMVAGGALAVSGLMLQTLFRNPLAGPSILGVSDGANLGVALVMLCGGGAAGFGMTSGGFLSIILAAFIGAGAVMVIIVFFSNIVNNSVMLLIIGIMTGYLASSVISILNWVAAPDQVNQFVMWGMGDFSSVSMDKLPWMTGAAILGISLSFLLTKQLNALLLGDSYAANLGVNIRRTRTLIFLSAGLQTAAVTAFCGPVSFIGLAVPHIARLLLGSSNHRYLLPASVLCGAVMALLCNLLTSIPLGGGILPLNAITPLIGAPVIIYVILNRRNIHYF